MNAAAGRPSFASGAVTLVAGNLAARALTLLLIPVVTRLFPPDAFGVFAAFDALLTLLGAICHLRYPMAVFPARKRGHVRALVLLSLLVSLGASLLVGLAVAFFHAPLADMLGMAGHPGVLVFLAPALFLGAASFTLLQLATRERRFAGMAGARIGSTAAERGVGIGLGLLGRGTAGSLIWGRMAGHAASIAILAARPSHSLRPVLTAPGTWLRLGRVAREYRSFALYSPSALLHQGGMALPPLILAMQFSPAVAGLYALCRSVLREPINLLGDALARAMYAEISDKIRAHQPIAPFVGKFTGYALDLILAPMAVAAVTAGPLFAFVFGEQWSAAAPYVALLAGFWTLTFLSRPLSCLFDVLHRLRHRAVFDTALFAAGLAGLLLGALLGGPLWAVGCYALAGSLVLLARIAWLTAQARTPVSVFLRGLILKTLAALPVTAAGWGLAQWTGGAALLAGITGILVLHYAALLFFNPSLKQQIMVMVPRRKA
ncbi:MAG: lipopolysaccharide biosynthesis protein [Desulfovibrio sp.]